jgi:type VI secretion system ImpC/EvpB family protein/type VI secretion system ImpB/VipA family protein
MTAGMPERFSIGNLELNVSGARSAARRTDTSPFRILLAGDFSGRENRGVTETVRGRKPRPVDLDHFDTVLARMIPRLDLELPRGEKIGLTFSKLDDFHPDRIWEQNEFFAPHREMRAQLTNAASFAAMMAETGPQAAAQPTTGKDEDIWKKLTDLPAAKASSASPSSAVASLIERAVAAHVVSGPDPRQADMVAAFDNAVSGQMRAILHHPHFQALEAAWRGVDFLLRNVDTDETLEVCLLDGSRAELAADLRTEDAAGSGVVEMILEQPVGSRPWTVMAGLLAFQPNDDDDADLLARLAKVAAAAGIPFLAAAGPRFLEAAQARMDEIEISAAWGTLRGLPEARHAGLIAPRFLLRLPYGKGTDEIDHFPFEEMPPKMEREALLWGNGALIAVQLLVTAWRDEGWGFAAPDNAQVSGLPVHVFAESGEKKLTPCGEVLLTDRVAENLLSLGVMPLASVRDRDSVRLLRFRSVGQPASGLAGF